ncbi:MAG: NfeD family protein [Verrucomicrobiae bacterium]|nr:NfeD family protein [Verrucomicrobiae bacterium]MCP5545927.1 NfeD family protein [Akkermansiaceae bacterium]
MTWIILLFVLGLALLAIEVIVPGGILGSIGALLMFGACALSFSEFGTGGGLAALAVALVLTAGTFWFEFRILPKTSIGKRAFLHEAIDGVSAAYGADAALLVGSSAKAVTMLSPSGYIDIGGKRYEAFCRSGQVPAGTALEVIGADNFRLIVTPSQPH